MNIVITQWALDSYLDLKYNNSITDQDYKAIIRPDVLRLKTYPSDPKFQNSKFWSIATDHVGNRIRDAYKMKWHNRGNGKNQLRLLVGMFTEAVICEAYTKGNTNIEKRKMAVFKTHLELIRRNQFTECGRL